MHYWDFPGGSVVNNPPASIGGTSSNPGLGGSYMPCTAGPAGPSCLSSLCSGVWQLQQLKPMCPRALLGNKTSLCDEKPVHH